MPARISITSRHNSHIKEAARLRIGRERQRRGRFIIDGAREVARALKSGIKPCEAYISDGFVGSAEFQDAVRAIESTAATIFQVSSDVFEKIAFGQRLQGIVVVAETPQRGLLDLKIPQKPLVAVIEGLEKPGNVGAILRSADAAGVDAIIVASGRTDLYNPNTIRASLGTIFRPSTLR